MNAAKAQVLIPAVTQQPDGPWSRDSSEYREAEQRQSFELDFNTYYDENIKHPVANILTTTKEKMPTGNLLFWGLLCIVIIGGFGIGWVGPDKIADTFGTVRSSFLLQNILFSVFPAAAFALLKYKKVLLGGKNTRSQKSEQLRSVIIPEIFRYLDNGCTFNNSPTLSPADLDFLGINSSQNGILGLGSSKIRYHCHDEVVGSRNGISFKMMEVEIEQERKSNNSHSSYYSTIFSGVYLLVDVPKPFKGRVDIKRDSEKFLSAVTNAFSNMQRVRLEDPEFEKVFQVYSNDQIEARLLMTTTMMQSLNDLRFQLGGKSLEGRFYLGQLALRIDCPHDLFEIDCSVEEEEYRDEAKKIIGDLNSIFKTIDAMDLNQQGII